MAGSTICPMQLKLSISFLICKKEGNDDSLLEMGKVLRVVT